MRITTQNHVRRDKHQVPRLFKEHKSYVLEEEQQKLKLDKFVADGAEEWDIKNAVSNLSNSISCLGRREGSLSDRIYS